MQLVIVVYEITAQFPANEKYGLVSQMNRSAVSIPSNIAEGRARGTRKDFCQFMIRAFSSGAELETQLELVKMLPFGSPIDCTKADAILSEVMRMLNAMIRKLKLEANSYKL